MSIGIDRLAALCPPELRNELAMLSDQQRSTLRTKIRDALINARKRGCRPKPRGTHPRAGYWRDYQRRRYARLKVVREKARERSAARRRQAKKATA